jgi:hypothetical protein
MRSARPPLGTEKWVNDTVKQLGLESTVRKRGRPRKLDDEKRPDPNGIKIIVSHFLVNASFSLHRGTFIRE